MIPINPIDSESNIQLSGGLSLGKVKSEETLRQQNEDIMMGSPLECRVCLQGSNQETNQLIAPCGCSGSLRYVHEKCFQKWLGRLCQDKTVREKKALFSWFHCQICKERIKLKYKEKQRCRNCQQLSEICGENKGRVICAFVMVILIGAFIGLLGRTIAVNPLDFKEKPTISVVLVLCMVALVAIEIGIIWRMVGTYCLTGEVVVTGIVSYYKRVRKIGNRGRKEEGQEREQ